MGNVFFVSQLCSRNIRVCSHCLWNIFPADTVPVRKVALLFATTSVVEPRTCRHAPSPFLSHPLMHTRAAANEPQTLQSAVRKKNVVQKKKNKEKEEEIRQKKQEQELQRRR